ncbi:MAG: hypothetical protein HYW00_00895 [Candidatus Colwellbacteria bacterium]|nr:hypothetical protein [Candidatus Colwellbacteria bacterium]
MTRRTIPEENIRIIQKARRSYYVSLPIQIVREFGWRESQKVVVEKRGREITIRDWKK